MQRAVAAGLVGVTVHKNISVLVGVQSSTASRIPAKDRITEL